MSSTLSPAPSVTAVVASHGRAELLRRALRSIAAQQYAGPLEIVVVFDQSPIDPLEDLRTELPPSVILNTCGNDRAAGLAGARNTGIARAAGTLIAFCDDDDEWTPHKLTAQVALWRERPDAAVIACGISIVTLEGTVDRRPPMLTTREDLLRSRVASCTPPPSCSGAPICSRCPAAWTSRSPSATARTTTSCCASPSAARSRASPMSW